ncbi:MAG: RNA-guided endonuclease InsQ/TnpB family protein [Peptostreptococcaceae bacterium]
MKTIKWDYGDLMLEIRGYQFEIYPNEQQKIEIQRLISANNYVYNGMLAYRLHRYKEFGEKYSAIDLKKKLKEIRETDTWLNEFEVETYSYAIDFMDRAYMNWVKQLATNGVVYSAKTLARCKRKGIKPQIWMAEKFPKFKGAKNNKQSYTTRRKSIVDNKINLGKKIGKVKIKLHSGFNLTKIEKQVTVSITPTGRYYVGVIVEQDKKETHPKTGKIVGIDVGVRTFATTSDNEKIHAPANIYKKNNRIAYLQKKKARQKKGSERYEKTRLLIAKHYEKLANTRKDFLNKLSTEIVKKYDIIAIEDLKISDMLKDKTISRKASNLGLKTFATMLENKSKYHEKDLIKVERYYKSSKTCSNCGAVKESLDRSATIYKCYHCGVEIDRDYNASVNLIREALSEQCEIINSVDKKKRKKSKSSTDNGN